VLIAMASGGSLLIFLDWPSVLIVGGGTLGVTLVNYTLGEAMSLVAAARRVFSPRLEPAPRIIGQFLELSIKARRGGILALVEAQFMQIKGPFMNMGVTLSLARARSVLEWLWRVEGMDPARLRLGALADSRPLQGNDTPAGRAADRRTEIVILAESR
jgi:hypothetical protein